MRWPNTSWKNTPDGAALEDRGTDVRLGERRLVERVEVGGDRR